MTDVADQIEQRRGLGRLLARNGWTIAVWVLLAGAIAWYSTLIPEFGSFQISSIAKNSLPTAFLAVSQGIIVIAGGIDLGVGAIMVLANAVAASTMEGQALWVTIAIGLAVVAGGLVVNGLVGWIITRSKVPDIVVTLATLFIFAGVSLLILPSPGGGTSEGFRAVFTGSTSGIGSNFIPSIVVLAVPVIALALWLRTSRQGLALRATGSDRAAAFLSGVNTARAKIVAYALGGGLAAMAGLAITAITSTGDARLSNAMNGTLNSVAAVVLGGIVLTGGEGSIVGAVAAGVILFTLNPILSAMGINPNTVQVIQGALIVAVMMVAGLVELRRRRRE